MLRFNNSLPLSGRDCKRWKLTRNVGVSPSVLAVPELPTAYCCHYWTLCAARPRSIEGNALNLIGPFQSRDEGFPDCCCCCRCHFPFNNSSQFVFKKKTLAFSISTKTFTNKFIIGKWKKEESFQYSCCLFKSAHLRAGRWILRVCLTLLSELEQLFKKRFYNNFIN